MPCGPGVPFPRCKRCMVIHGDELTWTRPAPVLGACLGEASFPLRGAAQGLGGPRSTLPLAGSCRYRGPSNNMGSACRVPRADSLINAVNAHSASHDRLNVFFPVADPVVGIQYTMYMTHKICVNELFMLLVRLLVVTYKLYTLCTADSRIVRRSVIVNVTKAVAVLQPEFYPGRVRRPDPRVVQGSTVYMRPLPVMMSVIYNATVTILH